MIVCTFPTLAVPTNNYLISRFINFDSFALLRSSQLALNDFTACCHHFEVVGGTNLIIQKMFFIQITFLTPHRRYYELPCKKKDGWMDDDFSINFSITCLMFYLLIYIGVLQQNCFQDRQIKTCRTVIFSSIPSVICKRVYFIFLVRFLIYVLILKRTIKNETVCKTHILKASLVG
jgi:hypothetical protein